MANSRRWATIVGLLGAVALFTVLLAVAGTNAVLDSLLAADRLLVVVTLALGVAWLATWSLVLRAVLAGMGVQLSAAKAFPVYASVEFANGVTPFGQAGGEPVAALLVSKITGDRYETGLAGMATVDVCNVVTSVSMAAIGVGYYATTATVGDRVQTAVGTTLALVVGLTVVGTTVWHGRETIVARLPAVVAAPTARLAGTRIDRATLEAGLTDRLRGFFDGLSRIGADRRRLAVVLGLSLAGWVLQATALVAAFAAVGYGLQFSIALFVIPFANLAGAAPLPGGLGGIEAAFVALLVPTTGVAVSAVTAAVLVFRAAVYWLPIVVGAGSATALGVSVVS